MNRAFPLLKNYGVLTALLLFSVVSHAQTIVQVLVNQPKKLEIVASDLYTQGTNTTILGDKVSISGGLSPFRYSWFKSGLLIGSTPIMEVPKSSQPNEFSLVVKDANNCSCSNNSFITNSDDIMEGIFTIEVYPNPVSEFIIINPNTIEGPLDISIFDSKGTLVMQNQIKGISTLNLKLNSGLYLLKIFDKNYQIVGLKKLIKL